MGRLVQQPAPAGADREHPSPGVRRDVLSKSESPGKGGRNQMIEPPGKPERFTQLEPLGHLEAHSAQNLAQDHGYGLQGLKPGPGLGDMPAQALGVPMLQSGKEPDPAFVNGQNLAAIRALHQAGLIGDDLALMPRGRLGPRPVGKEQVVFPHDPECPFAADPDPVHDAQARPHLAVHFAMDPEAGKAVNDKGQQLLVSPLWRGASLAASLGRESSLAGIERGARQGQDSPDPLHSIGLAGGRGSRLAHLRDLSLPKGLCSSTRTRNSSFSMLRSPIRFSAWSRSLFSGSPSRLLQGSLHPRQSHATPLLQAIYRDAQPPGQQPHRPATKHAKHHFTFAPHVPALVWPKEADLAASRGLAPSRTKASFSKTHDLSQLPLVLCHPKGSLSTCGLRSSQFRVQRNRGQLSPTWQHPASVKALFLSHRYLEACPRVFH